MKIGVLSDTHDHFDPALPEIFADVEHILHAGDIGSVRIIRALEQIAPVTAVLGNNDVLSEFRETEVVDLGPARFLLRHIVNPHAPEPSLARRLEREQPRAVIFGHTHRPFCETVAGRLFLNPGYAGRKRFQLARSVALVEAQGDELNVNFRTL
ncbi:MAG TPA: metallophosphoesterase family protein [Methylomirabilota bacterium]|nr:metallophosphoesterase family protein [Methylomirabilota bacterium]